MDPVDDCPFLPKREVLLFSGLIQLLMKRCMNLLIEGEWQKIGRQ